MSLSIWEDFAEEQERTSQEQKIKRANYLRSLAEVVSSAAGAEVFCTILQKLGAQQNVIASDKAVALYNLSNELLDDIGEASPKQCLNLIVKLRGLQG